MGIKVTYSHPAFPKGHVFALNGLGELPNETPVEFTDDQLDNFKTVNGVSLKEATAGNKLFKIDSSKGGDG